MVILCPGQGAQAVGMGRAWAEASPEARAVFDEADRIVGERLGGTRLSEVCFGGPTDVLNRTDVSQPAIYTASVACWRGMLAREGLAPTDVKLAATAGLSLGEYTALHLAGAVGFEEGLELVLLRGRAMQDAAEAAPGGMVALIGADEAQAQRVCDEANAGGDGRVVCANINAPGQVVISGDRAACERAAAAAQGAGLRATALPVAGAFHSPLMRPAAQRLGEALEKTALTTPRCVVMSNVTAEPHVIEGDPAGDIEPGVGSGGYIRKRLVEQLTSPVRWSACCTWLIGNMREAAAGGFHELAPGKTLGGLMRRIDRDVKVVSHDEPE